MRKSLGILLLGVLLLVSQAQGEEIFSDSTGSALRLKLQGTYKPTTSLSYKQARNQMFGFVDNENGEVTCVYTGRKLRTRVIPDHTNMNCEHTWPQSKFEGSQFAQKMKSDLHHLYVTDSTSNERRGNLPFAEIDDQETERWFGPDLTISSIPSSDIDQYSESTDGAFEPREDHKGNVARSMFYFFTMYESQGIQTAWFKPQIPTLLEWHEQDSADDKEVARTQAIEELQGNVNPFVLDPSLAKRAFVEAGGDGDTEVNRSEIAMRDCGSRIRRSRGLAENEALAPLEALRRENEELKAVIADLNREIRRLRSR